MKILLLASLVLFVSTSYSQTSFEDREEQSQLKMLFRAACEIADNNCNSATVTSMIDLPPQNFEFRPQKKFPVDSRNNIFKKLPSVLIRFKSGKYECVSKVPIVKYTSPVSGRQLIKPYDGEIIGNYYYGLINAGQCL